jgi:hypothetical protein
MNAHQIPIKPTTIGELKELIRQMEEAWTEQDDLYLGKFDDQGLYLDTGNGIGQAFIQYHGEFGFIAFLKE